MCTRSIMCLVVYQRVNPVENLLFAYLLPALSIHFDRISTFYLSLSCIFPELDGFM